MAVALWYCPPPNSACYDTVNSLILSLQTLFPDAVLFEPHVTITSQLRCDSAEDAAAVLAAACAALRACRPQLDARGSPVVRFEAVGVGRHYFDKVHLACAHDRFLYGVAQVIRELFVQDPPDARAAAEWVHSAFRPHLSLVYSDLYHVDQALLRVLRQRIGDALGAALLPRPPPPGLQALWALQPPLDGWSIPGALKVVRCEGPVRDWHVLAAADL
ncbi:AaceriAEL214Cp [[Ashbya] aceris (nom. inval.)]|nr:AaceriAEL214Cp [[Ashbya] aceris (nom. inval.)]